MKKVFLMFCVFGFLSFSLAPQETKEISQVKVGDVLKVGEVKNNSYQFINFSSANFIIKKGGIYTFKKVVGKKVIAIAVKQKQHSEEITTIKVKNFGSFFNSHKYVTVDIKNAIMENELILY